MVEDVAPHCIDGSLARTLAQTQTQTQTHAQAQGPRGTGLRQGKALQSPGKRKRQRSRECEIDDEELKMMMRLRSRFSHEFFFLAHGWSSAIYKGRNGTSIKYYKNAPCMRLPRLCRVDTVKR